MRAELRLDPGGGKGFHRAGGGGGMWLDKAATKASNKSNKKHLNSKSNSTRQHVRKGKSSTMAQVPGIRVNLEPDLKRQKTAHEGLNWELPVSAPNTVSRAFLRI